jgi:hypothetical protein
VRQLMWRSHSSNKRVQIYRDKIVADAVDDAVRPSVIMRHDSDAVDKSIASEAVRELGVFLTRGLSLRQQVTLGYYVSCSFVAYVVR